MARISELPGGEQPPPLVVSRVFTAPHALVFEAWSKAEHLKNWFCPKTFSVPQAKVEFSAGGVFEVCMRAPDGAEYWSRGHFAEIMPIERLVIDMHATGRDGGIVFKALTQVSFAEDPGGTRMEVRQDYTVLDAASLPMIQGAATGWADTLDRLGVELARMRALAPIAHATFRLERRYAAAPAKVFHAFSDIGAKSRWFAGGDGWHMLARSMDFRIGGREHLSGRWEGKGTSAFDAIYLDVVPDCRIIYEYEMTLDRRKISASLATLELSPDGDGTLLVVTEQGAFLDGYNDAGSRETGTGILLDQLGASLQE